MDARHDQRHRTAKVEAALHRLQKLPHLVQSFFRDPNLRYITA
jgi:hypothetical protein